MIRREGAIEHFVIILKQGAQFVIARSEATRQSGSHKLRLCRVTPGLLRLRLIGTCTFRRNDVEGRCFNMITKRYGKM